MNGECSCPGCNVCLKTGANLVEQAIEAAGLMLGSNKSRGYCLEMICAEFLAGANLDHGRPEVLLRSAIQLLQIPAGRATTRVRTGPPEESNVSRTPIKQVPLRLLPAEYKKLRKQMLRRDGWRCQLCGSMSNLEVHHQEYRSHAGEDAEDNLITLCRRCHAFVHEKLPRRNIS